MFAPALVPATLSPSLLGYTSAFRIARDGTMASRTFSAGEVLVLEGSPAADGDLVVLVALGKGRPRLGRVRGAELVGDRGEPCLRSRWAVAGRVAGVARSAGEGWFVERIDEEVFDLLANAPVVEHAATASPAPGQLSLFSAA